MSVVTTQGYTDPPKPYNNIYIPGAPNTPVAPVAPVTPRAPSAPRVPGAPYYPYQFKNNNLYSDYNNTHQINSSLDALIAGFNKKIPIKTDMGILNDYSGLRLIPASIDAFKQVGWEALQAGDWKAVATNQLINAGEVLDVLSNPVKGYIADGWGGAKNAFWNRYNYDYNTGNTVADFAGEFVSDPVTWISFGVKGVVSRGVKGALSALLKDAATKAGVDMADDVAGNFALRFAKEIMTTPVKYQEKSFLKLANLITTNNTAKTVFTQEFLNSLKVAAASDMSVKVLNATSKLVRGTETFDKILTKTAFLAPYAAYKSIKTVGEPATNFIRKGFQSTLKKAELLTTRGDFDLTRTSEIEAVAVKYANETGEEKAVRETFEDSLAQSERQIRFDLDSVLHEDVGKLTKMEQLENYFWNNTGRSPSAYLDALKKYNIMNDNRFTDLVDKIETTLDRAKFKDENAKLYEQKKLLNQSRESAIKEKDFSAIIEASHVQFNKNIIPSIKTLSRHTQFSSTGAIKTVNKLIKHFDSFVSTLPVEHTGVELLSKYIEHSKVSLMQLGQLPKVTPTEVATQATKIVRNIDAYIKESKGTITELAAIPKEVFGTTTKLGAGIKKQTKAVEGLLQFLQEQSKIDNPKVFINERQLLFNVEFKDRATKLFSDIHTFFHEGSKLTFSVEQQKKSVYRELLLNKYAKLQPRINALLILKEVMSKDGTAIDMQSLMSFYKKTKHLSDKDFISFVATRLKSSTQAALKAAGQEDFIKQYRVLFNELRNIHNTTAVNIENKLKGTEYRQLIAGLQEGDSIPLQQAQHYLSENDMLDTIQKQLTESIAEIKGEDTLLISSMLDKLIEGASRFEKPETYTEAFENKNILEGFDSWYSANEEVLREAGLLKDTMMYRLTELLEAYTNVRKAPDNDTFAADMISALSDFSRLCSGAVVKNKDLAPVLGDLQFLLDNSELYETKFKSFELQAERLLYQLKLEQNVPLERLLNDTTVNDFIKEICDPQSGYGRVIEQLVQAGDIDSQRLIDTVKNYTNYRAFLQDLYEVVGKYETHAPGKEVLEGIQSTIQRYAMVAPQKMLEDFNTYFHYIIEGTELYMNSKTQIKKLDLSSLKVSTEWAPEEKVLIDTLDKEHSAIQDAQFTGIWRRKELAAEFEKEYPGYNVIDADIETTNLKYNVDEITQIAYDCPELELRGGTLHTPAYEPLKSVGSLVQKTGLETEVRTELRSLYQFTDMIKSAKEKNPKILINMHNGNAFDKPYILHRLEYYGHMVKDPVEYEKIVDAIATIRSTRFSDSLQIARKKYGYNTVGDYEKDLLRSSIRYFLESQKDQVQLIRPIDTEFASMLKETARKIETVYAGDEAKMAIASEFRAATEAIYDVFCSIKSTNQKLGAFYIDRSIFDDLEFQKTYGLNITQMLHNLSDTNEDGFASTGLSWLAVRKGVNEVSINDVFAQQIGKQLNFNELHFKTKVSQSIIQNYQRLKHTTRIIREKDAIQSMLTVFLKSAQSMEVVPSALKELEITNNPFLNFAKLQFLYNYGFSKVPGYSKLLDAVLDTNNHVYAQYTDVLQYLQNPKGTVQVKPYVNNGELEQSVDIVLQTKRLAKTTEYTNNFMAKIDPEVDFLADYNAYYNSIKEITTDYYDDVIEKVNAYGYSQDTHGAARAVVHRRGTSLKETGELLTALTARHKNITDTQQQLKQIRKYKNIDNELMLSQLNNTLQLPVNDLFALLVNTPDHTLVMQRKLLNEEFVQQFIKQDLGNIQIHETEDVLILYLNKETPIEFFTHNRESYYAVNGVRINPPQLRPLDISTIVNKHLADGADQLIASKLINAYEKLGLLVGNLETGYSPHIGTLGESASKEFYKTKYNALPDKLKKELHGEGHIFMNDKYKSNMFNQSVLGTPDFRRAYTLYSNSDTVSTLVSTMKAQSAHLNTKIEYANMCVDEALSINGDMFKGYTDQEILDLFKSSGEWRLVSLVEDKQIGMKIVDMRPKNVHDIKFAKKLNAVMMDYQTFSTAYSTINTFNFNEGFLGALQKLTYLYKMGFLLSPGQIMRNFIDTPLKNYIAAEGDFLGLSETYMRTVPIYTKYNQTLKQLTQFVKGDEFNGHINAKSLEAFFNTIPTKLDKETFYTVYGFFVDGPGGGQSRELTKFFEESMSFSKWGKFTHLMNIPMYPNQVIEQVSRLAQFIYLKERKLTTNAAYYKIAQTHFDYDLKSKNARMLELIFPFYTFTINNINFWLNHLFETPWLGAVMEDAMTPIFNFDRYSPEELKYNHSMRATLLSGNPRLDEVHTLKLNPSFMDVYNLFMNPGESIKQKLAPLLQISVNVTGAKSDLPQEVQNLLGIPQLQYQKKLDTFLEALPLLGPVLSKLLIQIPRNLERGANPALAMLPSMFGAVKPYKGYKPKQYIKNAFATYTKKPKLFKPRKVGAKKVYAKKFYFEKYYPQSKQNRITRQTRATGIYSENFYRKLYTDKGNSRLALMTNRTTPQTLKYRIKDMYYYFK